LSKNGASDYKIKIIIKSYIARFAKWSDIDINSLPLFLCKLRSIQWLIEKENEEKIWKRLGEDLKKIWR